MYIYILWSHKENQIRVFYKDVITTESSLLYFIKIVNDSGVIHYINDILVRLHPIQIKINVYSFNSEFSGSIERVLVSRLVHLSRL